MADKRPTQNVDKTLIPTTRGGGRNALSRVYLEDGEPFQVIVRIGAEDIVVSKGSASTGAVDKRCALYIKTRVEKDVLNPADIPVAEIVRERR